MALINREEEERIYEERAGGPRRSLSDDILRRPVHVVAPAEPLVLGLADTIETAVHRMVERKIGSAVIADGEGKLVGIFTERDLMRKVVERQLDWQRPLREVMTTPVEAVPQHERIGFVLNRMVVGGYRHMPVIDGNRRPIGMISVRRLLRYLVEFFPEDVSNVPPRPDQEMRLLSREGE